MTPNLPQEVAEQLSPGQHRRAVGNLISRNGGGDNRRPLEIAIIGVSGRFPQAESNIEFWHALLAGKNLVGEVPANRWPHQNYYRHGSTRDGSTVATHCGYGAFVSNHDCFDADFFDISAEEAALMDPQERLGLEVAWTCIEDAGYRPERLGKTGVFAGITYTDFQKSLLQSTHAYTLSARIAYHCDFHGPTLTIDAGCCSSLSALHLACQSLRLKECGAALVMGSNLLVHPDHYMTLSPMLSTSSAPVATPYGTDDGWIPAEAVMGVLLKPLTAARADRDHVYGVIKSSHIGQQGRTSWFRAPNPKREAGLLTESFERAGINPATISYVEAAANGSSLGDSIEFEGLSQVFARPDGIKQFCPIGSVKANIGHGEGVSTLLQLTKVLLQFAAQKVLPVLSTGLINPNIRFDDSPFFLQRTTAAWSKPVFQVNEHRVEVPRRASISSAGTGGTFGHLLLEEFEETGTGQDTHQRYWVPFSAASHEQLVGTLSTCQSFLTQLHPLSAAWRDRYNALNVSYTLATGRVLLPIRVVFLASDLNELMTLVTKFVLGKDDPDILLDPKMGQLNSGDSMELWLRGDTELLEQRFLVLGAKRVSLPGYSFRRTCFPLPQLKGVLQGQLQATHDSVPTLPEEDLLVDMAQTVPRDTVQGVRPSETAPTLRENAESVPPSEVEKKDVRGQGAGLVLQTMVAELLGKPLEAIRLDLSYRRLGLQSMELVELARRLEHFKNVKIAPSEFFSYATLGELAESLAETLDEQTCPSDDEYPLSRPRQAAGEQGAVCVEDALKELCQEGLISAEELRLLSGNEVLCDETAG